MGWHNRRVASTSMNRESSRSHAVFTMTLESKETAKEVVNIRTSQLNLVDLAGSERQRDTHTEGSRLKVMLQHYCPLTERTFTPLHTTKPLEGYIPTCMCYCVLCTLICYIVIIPLTYLLLFQEASSINRSLMCLGQVIMALVDVSNGKSRHICYRDSKLTFLLRVKDTRV